MVKQPNFDRIVFFGDSFTDSGAFFSASSQVAFFGLPPRLLGYDDQFSNGGVYADLVPTLLDVEGGESLNFAVGDAQALTDRSIGEVLTDTGLIRPNATEEALSFRVDYGGQVDRFLTNSSGANLSGTAASILLGLNDFANFVPSDLAEAANEASAFGVSVAAATLQTTAHLTGAGVGTIILNTLPSLTILPSSADLTPQEILLSPLVVGAYNTTLIGGAKQLEQTGAEVSIVELGAMWEEIANDFESFGFRTFSEPVLLGQLGTGGPNSAAIKVPQDQIAFYDPVHPTTELHEILGVFQAESLTSEVAIGTDEDEFLFGGVEYDLILGRAGNDHLFLREGDDIAISGLGNDTAYGGAGNDLLAGGAGHDNLYGNAGQDILADGTGDDRSFGGRGSDVIIDGAGRDLAFGGPGDDVFIFTEASLFGRQEDEKNYFAGGEGHDTLVLRASDATANLVETNLCGVTFYEALGLVTSGVETVIIEEGTDTPMIESFEQALITAELWNFV